MKKQFKSLYSIARKYTPAYINGKINQLIFNISRKPTVKKDHIDPNKKFPNKERGGLIISADFEMSWAWRYTKTGADHIQKGRRERENLPKILEALEEYDIPITFATVGHLFLDRCEKGAHNWMKKIPHFNDHWKFTTGNWYDHDPYSNYIDAPEWYAPDLIKMIIDSPVKHEIGTHTFSHIDFSYKNCPMGVADDEITACVDAAKKFNIELKSIVFPGGTWGNIEILKKHNISIYRKSEDFQLAYPFRDHEGLLVSPSSGFLEYNLAYKWSLDNVNSRLIKYVDKAIRTNTIVHLWFHPSLEPFILLNVFPRFFSYISNERNNGNLWIGTMSDIAEHINRNNIL